MASNQSFYDTLNAALEDMLAHGFDSAERVAFWSDALKKAAEGVTKSQAQMEQMLRDAMASVYRRMIDKGGIAKFHPGIARFTIEKVRPALRAELDRRIMASANLIKLNKEQSIAKTLQRFQGWSTSIPPGGVSESTKAELKKEIRKPLASLPFEQRRVAIDQGAKFISSLNDILATDGGALAGRWHSQWRRPGYQFRVEHKERDGKVYLVRGSWAAERGLVKSVDGYTDSITMPAQEPYCSCSYTYLYSLSALPKEMLTAKGKDELAAVKERIKAL